MSADRYLCGDKCSQCNKAAEPGKKFLRCGSCFNAYYCNSQCQKEHWEVHKAKCGRGDPLKDMTQTGKTDKYIKELIRSVVSLVPKQSVAGQTWDRRVMVCQGGQFATASTFEQTFPALPLPGKCTRVGCEKDAPTLKCSRCQVAYYCSRECQVSDWKNSHKHVCEKPDGPVNHDA